MDQYKSRQLIYRSRARGVADLNKILEESKHNNALDGITGVLTFDSGTFTQALEGSDGSVAAAFARITADERHCDVEVLSDRTVDEREFGYWSMELAEGRGRDDFVARLARRLGKLPADLRASLFNDPVEPSS